jgi:cytochrome c biogenesis protein CcdA
VAEIQGLVTNWVLALAVALPFGYGFGAGMVAAVNPCGFVMLPAYLSLYLGLQEADFARRSPAQRVLRGLLVGVSVSAGFVVLFALAGVVISAGGRVLMTAMPWVGALIGVALVGLGLWQLAGRSVYTALFERLAERIANPKTNTLGGFFLFGLAYAAASLSCTLPVFMVVVGSGLGAGGFASGALQFLSYGLGMASVVVALTVALALFKQGVASGLRRAIPHVQRVAAALLLLAGLYLVAYWWPEVGARAVGG